MGVGGMLGEAACAVYTALGAPVRRRKRGSPSGRAFSRAPINKCINSIRREGTGPAVPPFIPTRGSPVRMASAGRNATPRIPSPLPPPHSS